VTTSHVWTVPNPTLELELDKLRRREPLPLELLEALDRAHAPAVREAIIERHEHVLTSGVRPEFYQRALALADVVESKKDALLHRARVRQAIANKLRWEVAPWARADRGDAAWLEYIHLAQRLEDARPLGYYGVDRHALEWGADKSFAEELYNPSPIGGGLGDDLEELDDDDARALAMYWTNRAGQVKLCPDDARHEANRVREIYGNRLAVCDRLGYVLRYAVLTVPNAPQWHLAAACDSIFEELKRRWLYARVDGKRARNVTDKKRLFPNLVGALATLEAPLSGRYARDPSSAWNVHLNVMLVFKPDPTRDFGMPDYEPLREAWGANVEWRTVPQGDPNATHAALRELVKYPLQAVSEKSAEERAAKRDRFGRPLTPAPPMIEWPPEYIDEWWRAHKSFRRTRSWGVLYDDRFELAPGDVLEIPKARKRDAEKIDWLGVVRLTPALCTVLAPKLDTSERDALERRRAFEHRARLSTEPAYRLEHERRARYFGDSVVHVDRRDAAARSLFDLIQGNKSAIRTATVTSKEASARAGPPIEPSASTSSARATAKTEGR
jgi:hypothetical protein